MNMVSHDSGLNAVPFIGARRGAQWLLHRGNAETISRPQQLGERWGDRSYAWFPRTWFVVRCVTLTGCRWRTQDHNPTGLTYSFPAGQPGACPTETAMDLIYRRCVPAAHGAPPAAGLYAPPVPGRRRSLSCSFGHELSPWQGNRFAHRPVCAELCGRNAIDWRDVFAPIVGECGEGKPVLLREP